MLHVATAPSSDSRDEVTLQPWECFPPPVSSPGSLADLFDRLGDDRSRQLRVLRGRLASREDAEDAWQDAAVKFLQHAQALGAAERPQAWMSVALRRLVIDRYRRAAVQRRGLAALAAHPSEDPADPAEDEDLQAPSACLKAALGGLKPDYVRILTEAYLEERPLRAVADRLELSTNNTAVRLHRARHALRRSLAQKCAACPLADCWGKQRAGRLLEPGPVKS